MQTESIHIIGGGLAGSEAAWQLAKRGWQVNLYEMRPHTNTPAHQTDHCGELVCSNSLRSDDPLYNAVGLLHHELRLGQSLIMAAADEHRVPAGSALAVDRHEFSRTITQRLTQHPLIHLHRQEMLTPPEEGWTIVASGPLTTDPLAAWIEERVGQKRLAFYDAIAPIVHGESIDFSKAWRQSRYNRDSGDEQEGDYINCPLNKEEYQQFIEELTTADPIPAKSFEKIPYFEGCMPIEEMARRGFHTLRFGPMKPVGLNNPHEGGRRPWAAVQLRQDNLAGSLWNMVGFQTRLPWPQQQRIFRTIPGLEQAEFMRLGALHRNTFIQSPQVLNPWLQLHQQPKILFAGQITGVEGYVESTACGWLAALFLTQLMCEKQPLLPPNTTAMGALLSHLRGDHSLTGFQPMNVNFGLFPPLETTLSGRERKVALAKRGQSDFFSWLQEVEK
ncbi:MAG: methylenetetrahydrofolate--tRNA-(uracil(54)-C(5))-methyltransferase (FADH(2)-oxidizing) TrmFO [Magnetococcales bacterium]|nr:methylenetetrahydrofolate--tRNA-(uracil(54)-C(5))-methyltransferase (FADH(2)-oxidizing) TrmFO [Magnetococcales bacterium]NGZ27710.1 methylenetetrahydrofolate--tRNA-(uracil(54)-C(5))-methyltransferase (FADH(2)-oxidizing) TrmFO [Magnetococcales bacterium]